MPKRATDILTTEVTPDPRSEKRTRRFFTRDYKFSILQQAEACQHVDLGVLMRRKKLYPNQSEQWRREFKASGAEALENLLPAPKRN